MIRLIADVYRIINHIINHRLISFFIALLYTSLLNLLMIHGLCILLKMLLPLLNKVEIAFRFPYIIGLYALIMLVSFWMMLPLKNLSKEKGKPIGYATIIIYSLISLVLFLYAHYEEFFFS